MKVKTREATGLVLDFLVAKAQKWRLVTGRMNDSREAWFERADSSGTFRVMRYDYRPSLDGAQAVPIFEEKLVCVDAGDGSFAGKRKWSAWLAGQAPGLARDEVTGPTMLVAGLRCYVLSELGDEVEIPEELL